MILQYLFRDKRYREEIEQYNYTHDVKANRGENKGQVTKTIVAEKTIQDLNDECWVVQFKITEPTSLECARHLSIINEKMMEYSPIIIDNGASAYFNQRLYPLINTFEMRLRKFLFLSISLAGNQSLWKRIKDLEKKDFYTIYLKLFTSSSFNKRLYLLFPESKPQYTKSQIQEMIEAINEDDILWDMVVGDKLSSIKKQFSEIKSFRNDVMHAHCISNSQFNKAYALFNGINKELALENDQIIQFSELIESDDKISIVINDLLDEYGDTPISVVEAFLKTAGDDMKLFLQSLLDNEN